MFKALSKLLCCLDYQYQSFIWFHNHEQLFMIVIRRDAWRRTSLTLLIFLVPSSPPGPGAQPHQPQPHGHPGVLATSSIETEPWSSFQLPLVLSHQFRECSNTNRAARRKDQIFFGKPAAWHHLPSAHCCRHKRRVGGAVSLDVSPHSKGIQCSRYMSRNRSESNSSKNGHN